MVTVGMGLAWLGYSLIFWGYCEIKGYDISLVQIMIPGKYTGSWPPGVSTPGATTAASGASTNGTVGASTTPVAQNANGGNQPAGSQPATGITSTTSTQHTGPGVANNK